MSRIAYVVCGGLIAGAVIIGWLATSTSRSDSVVRTPHTGDTAQSSTETHIQTNRRVGPPAAVGTATTPSAQVTLEEKRLVQLFNSEGCDGITKVFRSSSEADHIEYISALFSATVPRDLVDCLLRILARHGNGPLWAQLLRTASADVVCKWPMAAFGSLLNGSLVHASLETVPDLVRLLDHCPYEVFRPEVETIALRLLGKLRIRTPALIGAMLGRLAIIDDAGSWASYLDTLSRIGSAADVHAVRDLAHGKGEKLLREDKVKHGLALMYARVLTPVEAISLISDLANYGTKGRLHWVADAFGTLIREKKYLLPLMEALETQRPELLTWAAAGVGSPTTEAGDAELGVLARYMDPAMKVFDHGGSFRGTLLANVGTLKYGDPQRFDRLLNQMEDVWNQSRELQGSVMASLENVLVVNKGNAQIVGQVTDRILRFVESGNYTDEALRKALDGLTRPDIVAVLANRSVIRVRLEAIMPAIQSPSLQTLLRRAVVTMGN